MTFFRISLLKIRDSLFSITTLIISAIGLYSFFYIKDKPIWLTFTIILGYSLIVLSLLLEFRKISGRHIYYKKDESGIAKFMDDFITSTGELIIFTTTFKWANYHNNRKILEGKASDKDLTIIMPNRNKEADSLKKLGAKVYYCNIKINPRARFTIVNMGQPDSCIAIGLQDERLHRIKIYKINDPIMQLASDLINIIKQNITAES